MDNKNDIPTERNDRIPVVEEIDNLEKVDESTETTPESFLPQELDSGSSPPYQADSFEDVNFEDSNSKFKKIIFIVVFVLIIISISIIVGKLLFGKSAKKEKIKLVYWGLWEEKSVMEPLITKYQKHNPSVVIEYIKQSPKNYRQKIISQIKDGRGPDIFRYHNTWVPMLKDILSPLPENIMSKEVYKKTFYPVIQEDLELDSKYVGIPLEIDGLMLVYNDDIFKRAGIMRAPETWEDLIVAAKELTVPDENGRIVTAGIALGTANNIEHFSDILGWMMLQNGVDINNLNSNNAVKVLQSYREFAEPQNGIWSEDFPNNIVAFAEGKVAMVIVPSWQILTIKQLNPSINIKTAQLPLLPGDTTPLSIANYWVEGVSKGSKNQIEAWKFLNFLVQRDNLIKLYQNQAKTRLFGEPYSRVDCADLLIQHEYVGPIIAQAPYLKSIPVVARTFDDGLNDRIVEYLRNAINDTIKQVSYADALSRAHDGIQQVLQTYKIK